MLKNFVRKNLNFKKPLKILIEISTLNEPTKYFQSIILIFLREIFKNISDSRNSEMF